MGVLAVFGLIGLGAALLLRSKLEEPGSPRTVTPAGDAGCRAGPRVRGPWPRLGRRAGSPCPPARGVTRLTRAKAPTPGAGSGRGLDARRGSGGTHTGTAPRLRRTG